MLDDVFPFGHSGSAQLYLWLYMLTLVVHMVFIGYLVGGLLQLVVSRNRCATLNERIKDALPFALGLGITAGVAPFLFGQILYKREMYTAQLLLPGFWLVVVPLLMMGFYGLYLQKTAWAEARPRLRWYAWAASLSIFFVVAWGWSTTHLLSVDSSQWVDVFVHGSYEWRSGPGSIARLAIWLVHVWPLFVALAFWQCEPDDLGWLGKASITSCLLAAYSMWRLNSVVDFSTTGVWVYAFMHWAAAGLHVGGWVWAMRGGASRAAGTIIGAGAVAMALGLTMVREAARVVAIRPHGFGEVVFDGGAAVLFVVFLLINSMVIVLGVRIVLRAIRRQAIREPEARGV